MKQFGEKLSIDLLRLHCTCVPLFPPLSYRLPREVTTFIMLSVQHLPSDLADDKPSTAEGSSCHAAWRPETRFSSVGALCRGSWQRFAGIWTRHFILSLLAGQIVSLCITCTSVATEALTSHNWALPTTQTLFLCPPFLLRMPVNCLSDRCVHRYTSLFVVYTPYTIYQCMLPILNILQKTVLIPCYRWFRRLAEDYFQAWLEMYIHFTHFEFILGVLLMLCRYNFGGLRRRGEFPCRKGQPSPITFPNVDPQI